MTRPRYETESDLVLEWHVIRQIETRWRCEAHKLPISYGLDFALVRGGQICAAVEMKRRSKRYGSLMISMHKLTKARDFRDQGVPTFFVIAWPDGVYYHEISDDLFPIGWGGRIDRGDSADVEPVAHIPAENFKSLFSAAERLLSPKAAAQ